MAALTHYSKPYLSLVETGRRPVTAEIIQRYEQALGVAIGTRRTRSDSPTNGSSATRPPPCICAPAAASATT
jgi:hypothetical protein